MRSVLLRGAWVCGVAAACVLSLVFAGSALTSSYAAGASAFAAPVKLSGGCGGEPSIDHDHTGHVYVSSPKGILAGVASCEGTGTGSGGVATWVSADGGKTFGAKITAGTLNGGGDSDTTVDPHTGDVYVADLEAVAADVCVSHDHGHSYVTAVTGKESCTSPVNLTGQAGPDNDREWVVTFGPTATYPHRDVYLAFHDFTLGVPLVYRSQDAKPFTPLTPPPVANPSFAAAVANGTVVAKPVIDGAGTIYALVTTQGKGNGPLDHLWLIKSTNHGGTWTATSIYDGSAHNAVLGLIFNDLAVDGAGNLYALALGNAAGAVPPANAYLFSSKNHGSTWSAPKRINTDGHAIALPALHGGPKSGDLAIGWYHSTNTADPNNGTGRWQYQALISQNAASAIPTFTTAVLGATENPRGYVHQGSICTLGIACTPSPTDPTSGNRNLADFTSVTVNPSGCAVYTYADDGAILADQSNYASNLVNNDVARQTTGCFQKGPCRGGLGNTSAPPEPHFLERVSHLVGAGRQTGVAAEVHGVGVGVGGIGARVGLEERWGPEGIQQLRELYEPLRRFAAVIGRWDVDPDDLVQDAYAKVLVKHPGDIRDLGPYLRRAIVNLSTDERRRTTRSSGVLRRIGAPLATIDSYPSDLEDIMRVEPRVRALLYLVEIEGQPVADAAEVVGMTHGSARVALMRARRRLRAELTMEANGE